jgi:hypothetical protein
MSITAISWEGDEWVTGITHLLQRPLTASLFIFHFSLPITPPHPTACFYRVLISDLQSSFLFSHLALLSNGIKVKETGRLIHILRTDIKQKNDYK